MDNTKEERTDVLLVHAYVACGDLLVDIFLMVYEYHVYSAVEPSGLREREIGSKKGIVPDWIAKLGIHGYKSRMSKAWNRIVRVVVLGAHRVTRDPVFSFVSLDRCRTIPVGRSFAQSRINT